MEKLWLYKVMAECDLNRSCTYSENKVLHIYREGAEKCRLQNPQRWSGCRVTSESAHNTVSSEGKCCVGRVSMPPSELSHTPLVMQREDWIAGPSQVCSWSSGFCTENLFRNLTEMPRCLWTSETILDRYLNLLFCVSACIYFCCNMIILLLNLITVFKCFI